MKKIVLILLIAFNISILFAQSAENQKDSSAFNEVNSWLRIVDEKDYAKSWSHASELFQRAVTKEQWENAAVQAREPFGSLMKREKKSEKYNTELPGMPDGQYYSFEFSTSFEKKKQSVETITVVYENGKWRVIGYFIR